MAKEMWVYDPQSGGQKISDAIKAQLRQRILDHAERHYAGKYSRIEVRFRGKFCYIDAYTEPYVAKNYDPQMYGESREEHIDNTPIHQYTYAAYGISVMRTDGQWLSTPIVMKSTSSVSFLTAVGMGHWRKLLTLPQCI